MSTEDLPIKPAKPFADDPLLHEKDPVAHKILSKIAGKTHPLDTAGIFSRLFFSFINPILKISKRVVPTTSMLHQLPKKDRIESTTENLREKFYVQKYGLIRCFFSAYKCDNAVSILASILVSFVSIFTVWITNKLVLEVETQLKSQAEGQGKITDPKKFLTLAGSIVGLTILTEVVNS